MIFNLIAGGVALILAGHSFGSISSDDIAHPLIIGSIELTAGGYFLVAAIGGAC